jgi:DNA (cytosine-5)-methyltransferase 1
MPEEPNEPLYIARVVYMWEKGGEKYFHGCWLNRGGETVLGETSDPCELFLVDMCCDTLLSAVMGKVCVEHRAYPSDWQMLGGKGELECEGEEQDDQGKFFFQKWYDCDSIRFEDPPLEYLNIFSGVCPSCVRNECKVRGEANTKG